MNKIRWFLFLLLISIICYLREILFLSINQYISGNLIFYANSIEIPFLKDYTSQQLTYLKVALTLLFTALISGVSILGLKKSFTSKLPFLTSILGYTLVSVFAVLYALFLYFIGNSADIYTILRLAIEYLHSPLFYLLFSCAYFGVIFMQDSKIKKQP